MFLEIKLALLAESSKKMKDEDLDLLFDSMKEIDNKLSYVIKKLNDMDELYFNLYQKHYPIIDNSPLSLGEDFRNLEPTTHNIKRMNEAVERAYQNDLKEGNDVSWYIRDDDDDEDIDVIAETKLKDS